MVSITDPNWSNIKKEDKTWFTTTITYKGETYSVDEQGNSLYALFYDGEIGYVELFESMGIDYPTSDEDINSLSDDVEMSWEEWTDDE